MKYTYLALGDSYTIGELVPIRHSFPYQTVQLLRQISNNKYEFLSPEIIAQTGWTTDELMASMLDTDFLNKYDVVSLLIGVNNQYRGRELENYEQEFEQLLMKAIALAGGKSNSVFVLSIPDWGVTPFAADRDKAQIANEIDLYNKACEEIALENQCHFIEITSLQREEGSNPDFLAGDGLHPSRKEYTKWAGLVFDGVAKLIS